MAYRHISGQNLTDRRTFLTMAGAAWAATLAPKGAFALSRTDAIYASAFMAPNGSYGVATLTEAGEIIEQVPLPAPRAWHDLVAGDQPCRCLCPPPRHLCDDLCAR